MRLLNRWSVSLVLALPLWSLSTELNSEDVDAPGGSTTVAARGQNAFSFPFANLDDEGRARFVVGNSFFKRNWVQSPASTTARDGLGPHFIARSCSGCHSLDGRGSPSLPNTQNPQFEAEQALLMRLSIPGTPDPHAGVRPEPTYGDQLTINAVDGVKAEGKIQVTLKPVHGRYADGTPYTLQAPQYKITQLQYGPMVKDVLMSPRIAPQLIGVGLLDAIAESDILDNVKRQAALNNGMQGQVNWVWDAFHGSERVGRFGWKANAATLAHQTSAAFLGDMGITSSRFGKENCTASQTDCLQAPHGGGKTQKLTAQQATAQQPEIDDATLNAVIFYQSTLAPPARRDANTAKVDRGQALFMQAQCSVCHRPSYVTQRGPFAELTSEKAQNQRIFPYTDLLLHDMGPALADNRPDFKANGRQWKTPPLWGIGLIPEVNGHQRLMHDGRARNVEEAVLWHGGQAQSSRNAFIRFSAEDRAALIAFVNSL